MKKIILIFLLFPFIAKAQSVLPRFENDTLYTTSGYKIFNGQILQLASGTAENGKFRFIKLQNGGENLDAFRYERTSILVRKLSDYVISGLGNHYIGISGTVTYKDGSKSKINIDINFDRAIENFAGLPSELIISEEFKNKKPAGIIDEIERLFKLYKEGALTQEEFEAVKKKLINKN